MRLGVKLEKTSEMHSVVTSRNSGQATKRNSVKQNTFCVVSVGAPEGDWQRNDVRDTATPIIQYNGVVKQCMDPNGSDGFDVRFGAEWI